MWMWHVTCLFFCSKFMKESQSYCSLYCIHICTDRLMEWSTFRSYIHSHTWIRIYICIQTWAKIPYLQYETCECEFIRSMWYVGLAPNLWRKMKVSICSIAFVFSPIGSWSNLVAAFASATRQLVFMFSLFVSIAFEFVYCISCIWNLKLYATCVKWYAFHKYWAVKTLW